MQAAMKALEEASGAGGVSYGLAQVPSLLQTRSARRSSLATTADLANFEAVRLPEAESESLTAGIWGPGPAPPI